ncbi:DUF1648 domain-containing protein [Streptomyces sp. bgisy153]|uniref:DUF1648 domain-containing protein n=1 Tax=Streptomyces sp. bgisy153 TaxID=3413793 RepID=UPI003D72AF2E
MMNTRGRAALAGLPFGVVAVGYVAVFLARYDRLPERMATHYSGDGSADGFMSRAGALWLGGGLLVGLGVLFTLLTLRAGGSAGSRLTAATAVGTAVTVGYPLLGIVLVNTDIDDPARAGMPLWHLAVLVPAALAAGAAAWWVIGAGPEPAGRPASPTLPLADGEAAAWSRSTSSRALLPAAAVIALCGVSGLVAGPWWAGAVPLVLSLLCLAFARVRVTVDRRGLTVASAVLPGPRLTVPLDRVADAASVQVDAMGDFGGWGYRIRPHKRGVVLRSGEALAVRTADGPEYVVTVDDAATAAALLNGLVERRARERG